MSEILPKAQAQMETARETWKMKTLTLGALLGAVVGVVGAFMLVQNADKKDAKEVKISSGEAFRLAVLIFGLLRQIATLHEE